MLKRHKRVGRTEGQRMAKAPLAVGALAMVILLMTIGDVASAQTSTANVVAVNIIEGILSPGAVGTSGPGSPRVIAIPHRPDLRSPYQPPSWTPTPPPLTPGRPDWAPGPPPWASNNTNKALVSKSVKAKR